MQYSFKFAGFWNHILLDTKNLKPVPIVLKSKKLKNNAKFEYHKKHANKILAWIKTNIKCKNYINHICLGHI